MIVMRMKTVFRDSSGTIGLAVLLLMAGLAGVSCKKSDGGGDTPPPTVPDLVTVRSWLTDKKATAPTAALFYNLQQVAKTSILFGHQDDTKRGVGWANEQGQTYDPGKSDVKEVTGAFPAVYGWDFNFIAGSATGAWFTYENQRSHDLTVDAYNRGGVNTYCWHYGNPVSGGSFYWDQSPVEAVSKILPGGSHHAVFKTDLQKVAAFAKTLIGADGQLVPVIFRPFHEFDGDWFWWGQAHCSAEDYKKLYQFTVTYLRDSLEVRNFLYAWSPDKNFTSATQYLARYPGDAYVDVLGTDNYGDVYAGVNVSIAADKLKMVSDLAIGKNKVAALTETGLQNLTQTNWYTQTLLPILKKQSLQLAYVLVWANRDDAFWTPYKGHPAATDFTAFKNNAYLVFGDKVTGMYQLK
jgi:mannan endo-1,4-beta-mannosidase